MANPAAARRNCAFQAQSQAPIEGIPPRQAIELVARIRGASRRHARSCASELLKALDIEQWADQTGDRLSGGVKRLTAFCMTAVHPGRVVMFDEPTNDVDPVRRRLLWKEVRALADRGCAVLLVTHNVNEAERAVDRLIILDEGREIVQGTPAQLRGNRAWDLKLEVVAGDANVAADLALRFDAIVSGRRFVTHVSYDQCAAAIAWAQHHKLAGRVAQFAVTPSSLEDLYVDALGADTEITAAEGAVDVLAP